MREHSSTPRTQKDALSQVQSARLDSRHAAATSRDKQQRSGRILNLAGHTRTVHHPHTHCTVRERSHRELVFSRKAAEKKLERERAKYFSPRVIHSLVRLWMPKIAQHPAAAPQHGRTSWRGSRVNPSRATVGVIRPQTLMTKTCIPADDYASTVLAAHTALARLRFAAC